MKRSLIYLGGIPATARKQKRGIALIIVLACLALMVVMIIAFLGSIGSEVQTSKFYANGASVKLLAQSTTDLVMAEIRDATSDGTRCWASQPGMIRTWDTTGSAAGAKYFKLYSDSTLTGVGAFDHTVTLVPDGVTSVNGSTVPWYNQQGVYVDLNQPVSVNGVNQYPIVDGDPNDLTLVSLTGNTTSSLPAIAKPVASNTVKVLGTAKAYPGLPNGFWLNSLTPAQSSTANQAPMPVMWLYVLKDGNIAIPDVATSVSTTVAFTHSSIKPTQANPIVGRMAFWTDDETCKVNINTASEGTYWAPPIEIQTGSSNPNSDPWLSSYLPVEHEYQRYPGHPAMTSLSTVFSLSGTTTAATESIFSITPRLGPGGSMEATVKTTQGGAFTPISLNSNRLYSTSDEYIFQPSLTGNTSSSTRIPNSSLANAPSITPALLKQNRFFLTANSRSPDVNVFNQPRICMWPISSTNSSSYRSPFDQLIAFCSTVNGNPYYFQRGITNYTTLSGGAADSTSDLPESGSGNGLPRNWVLLKYLRYLAGQQIPGFGGSFANKYNQAGPSGLGTDCDQILTEAFDYIRSTNLRDPYLVSNGNSANTYSPASSTSGSGQVVPIVDPNTGTRGFGRFLSVKGGTFQIIANADSTTNPVVTGTTTVLVPSDPITMGGSGNGTPATPVASGNVRVQAAFFPQLTTVSPGSVFIYPKFTLMVNGLDKFSLNGTSLGLPSTLTRNYSVNTTSGTPDAESWGDAWGLTEVRNIGLVGTSFDIPAGTASFASTGDVSIYLLPYGTTDITKAYQTAVLHYPNTTVPTPTVFKSTDSSMVPLTDPVTSTGTFISTGLIQNWNFSNAVVGANTYYNMRYFSYEGTTSKSYVASTTASGTTIKSLTGTLSYTYHGRLTDGFSDAYSYNSSAMFIEGPYSTIAYTPPITGSGADVVRSVGTIDARLSAAQATLPSFSQANYPFAPVGNYTSSTSYVRGNHTFWSGDGRQYFGAYGGGLARNANYDGSGVTGTYYDGQYHGNMLDLGHRTGGTLSALNNSDALVNGATLGGTASFTAAAGQVMGDWDNGVASVRDGPYINKADEGDAGSGGTAPYNWKGDTGLTIQPFSIFSPNRMIPSPGMLGSLPTGVFANRPFQTLQFRAGPIGHTGLGTSTSLWQGVATTYGGDQGPPYTTSASTGVTVQGPPDHLIMDLFSMPVVEPYAISEPLSTAGRINMNTLIVPFNYINRDTGLRAVLKSEKVISIADYQATTYKNLTSNTGAQTPIRWPINYDATLSQFYARRFNNKDIFRSPSEICDIDIIPDDSTRSANEVPFLTLAPLALNVAPTRAQVDNYWNSTTGYVVNGNTYTKGHRITGDNSRERIYATLYPRLTTKSNTFTVHFRVQTLKPALGPTAAATAWGTWREGTDVVTSEYRGSQTIERYVDPNDSSLPDFASNPSTTQTLAPYYRFRVLSTKQFAP